LAAEKTGVKGETKKKEEKFSFFFRLLPRESKRRKMGIFLGSQTEGYGKREMVKKP
jgi:hypothetical protein